MKQRLNNESRAQTDAQSEQAAERKLEFASAEDLLRYDAAQTVAPAQLRERVLRSVRGEKASLPWWKRWFQR